MKLGLIGHPVSHSLSPAMQHAALNACGIEGQYDLFDIAPAELGSFLEEASKTFRGLNVTIPHKENVIPFLDHIDPVANSIGAVNTIVFKNGKSTGYNTDAQGFMDSLNGLPVRGECVLVLGAGGAARAICVALRAAGALVTISNRSFVRAVALKEALGLEHAVEWSSLRSVARLCNLLVSTTSASMLGEDIATTFANHAPLDQLKEGSMVVDIVYRPKRTKLLLFAEKRGLSTIDGTEMLVRQGALAFELWTGKSPCLAAMRTALYQNL